MPELCGAIRPRDGVTRCNEPKNHEFDHHLIGDPVPDGDSGGFYRPHLVTWSQEGIECCESCGWPLDARGMCTAPLSAAD